MYPIFLFPLLRTVIAESEGDVAGEMECEMQARDFFFHIGMLILEGRTPEHSDKGRVEGPHCLSLFSVVPHVCDRSVDHGVSLNYSTVLIVLYSWFSVMFKSCKLKNKIINYSID